MITRYGYGTIMMVALLTLVGAGASWLVIGPAWLRLALSVTFLGFLVFTVAFFRDPDRITPSGEHLIVAPADGKVVLIRNIRDEEYIRDDAVQVSVFMSPLNVHVNRFPVSGNVTYFRYIPGEYIVAFDEKSSLRNERTHIGIETGSGRVLFKQIAGFIARRIVAEVSEGAAVRAGERFGMIRFGSRVDILFPQRFRLRVKEGDRTVAGETVIAEES